MSIISEVSLELSQDDPPPPGTSSMSHCARESGSRSPAKKYAKLEDGAASIRSDDQDIFLARVRATEPKRCATPTPFDQEVTQPLFPPGLSDALFDSSADSSEHQVDRSRGEHDTSVAWRTDRMIHKQMMISTRHGKREKQLTRSNRFQTWLGATEHLN